MNKVKEKFVYKYKHNNKHEIEFFDFGVTKAMVVLNT
jgi:hypothetical protein